MEKREVGYFSYEFSLDQIHWFEEVCGYKRKYLLNPKEEELLITDYNGIDRYAFSYEDKDGFLGLFGRPIKVLSSWDDKFIIHENDTVYVRKRWHKDNLTMEQLSHYLSADDFIQYMKDRGITICPMNVM